MNNQDLYYFNLLKKAVETTFLKRNNMSHVIETWKGEDIVLFQEDLFFNVKAKVSEKWFYTYFKNDAKKLPRIDMLNLLCKYAGFKDWHTFKTAHKRKPKFLKGGSKSRYLLLLIPFAVLVFFNTSSKNKFHFCFIDDIKNEPISKIVLDINVLQHNESPIYYKTDSMGCFTYETRSEFIKFIVKSPYHKTDTVIRYIDSNSNKIIKLTTDDYALMLHYYSNGNVKDWRIHKERLYNLIANDAQIYQLFHENIGVELFSKEEFIRFITIPTDNLRRVEILDKTIKQGKITKLKFIVK